MDALKLVGPLVCYFFVMVRKLAVISTVTAAASGNFFVYLFELGVSELFLSFFAESLTRFCYPVWLLYIYKLFTVLALIKNVNNFVDEV